MVNLNFNKASTIDERILAEMHALKNSDAQLLSENSKKQIAGLIGASTSDIIFTSSVSEAIHLGFDAIFETNSHKGNHIIVSKTEHQDVQSACEFLQKKGAKFTFLDVDREGRIDLQNLKESFTKETILVSIVAATHDTGVLQDLEKIAEITRQNGAVFFSDTSQLIGKLPIDVAEIGLDFGCISSHNLFGPPLIGALYIKNNPSNYEIYNFIKQCLNETDFQHLNLNNIIGFGKACEIAQNEFWDNNTHTSKLRGYLEHQLLEITDLRINGSTKYRLYNTSNICFPALKNGDSVSSHINKKWPLSTSSFSSVLNAMGLDEKEINNSIKFSFGHQTKHEDVEQLTHFILSLYDI